MTTVTPFNGTQSGTLVGTVAGSETFTRTVTDQAGVRTADTVFTLANGSTVTRDATLTRTPTGWTRQVTTTLADGKVETLNEAGTRQDDGSTSVTGTFQRGTRWTEDVSGTDTRSAGTTTADLTYSNPWGATRTRDSQTTNSGGVFDTSATGTRYSGASFSSSDALTILQSQAT